MKDSTEGQTTIIPASPGYWATTADVPDPVAARARSALDIASYLTGRLSPVVAWKIIDGPGGAIAYPVTPSGIEHHDPDAPAFVITPEGLVRGEAINFSSITDFAKLYFDAFIGGTAGAKKIQQTLNETISEMAMRTAIGKARGC